MQYKVITYGTHQTSEKVFKMRKDDNAFSLKTWVYRWLKTQQKGLYTSIKIEVQLDGVLVDTVYGLMPLNAFTKTRGN